MKYTSSKLIGKESQKRISKAFILAVMITTLVSFTGGAWAADLKPLLPNDLVISSANARGEPAAVAFDGSRYLVVWSKFRDDTVIDDIYGQFVDLSGALSGAPFLISHGERIEKSPSIAFNGSYYFVVWYFNAPNKIKGQVVATDGQLLGSVLDISSTVFVSSSGPEVASDGSAFLVVWGDYRNISTNAFDILGQLVAVDGTGNATLNEGNFPISPATESQQIPSVAFGSTMYLVTWTNDIEVNAGQYDIFGAMVDSSGTVSAPIAICTAPSIQGNRETGISFDGSNFLVVFDDHRDGTEDVFGVRVSETGVLLDGPPETGGIPISTNPGSGSPSRPKVAFSGTEWLVVWGGTRIEGARVSAHGVVLDAGGIDLYVTPSSQWRPEIASDGTNYLVTWTSSPSPYTIFAQLVDPAPIYVGPGETYTTIQAAVNAANDGDTIIVRDGTYTENVDVNRQLTIQSENGYSSTTVVAVNSNDHVFDVDANYVSIIGFTVQGATEINMAAIDLRSVQHCEIANNKIKDNYNGIYLYLSHNNVLTGNTIFSNVDYPRGIVVASSNNNTLTGNSVSSCETGIALSNSHGNRLTSNTTNNNTRGVTVVYSNNNTIEDNILSLNNQSGILMQDSATGNIITNNTANSNVFYGIQLKSSSTQNMITNNDLSDNGSAGIFLGWGPNNNTIMNNTVELNTYGIWLWDSSGNTIYLNNFSNNSSGNVNSQGTSTNTWYSPTPIYYDYNSGSLRKSHLGNYYSNHILTDSDGDGITDSDYDLPGDEPDDECPLAATSDNYSLEAWWLHSDNKMYKDDASKAPGSITINGGGSHIWIADQAVQATMSFSGSDTWTGQVVFTSVLTSGHAFAVEIGYSTNGSDFTPGGPDATLTGDGNKTVFTYQTDTNLFSIPTGNYLAIRIINNSVSDYDVITGGAWSYISSAQLDFDSDSDGMLDSWEIMHFDDLSHDGNGDSETPPDGLTDLEEYQNNTDPNDCDSDDDGMADGWEVDNNLNPNVDNAGEDADGDKFTNGREYQDQTDPNDDTSHLIFPEVTGRIPDTGQTNSYTDTFGEDSDYTINPPSYIKMDAQGNYLADFATSWAMVRDNVTGLIWEVKTDDGSIHDKDNTYTWYDNNPDTNGGDAGTPGEGTDTEDFINALNTNNFGGYSDWRLPTVKELKSIANSDAPNPAINTTYFSHSVAKYYWSSTTYAGNAGSAWRVDFNYGYVDYRNKSSSYYVRAVRAGQSGSFDNLIINGDGTVTDTSTGLMWQQETGDGIHWEAALTDCEDLNFAEYDDWRLPNINELQSLADYGKFDPAIGTTTFPGTASSDYWSSTTNASYTFTAWLVYFNNGDVYYDNKSYSYYVRAVRGGQNKIEGSLVISIPSQASRWNVGDLMLITWGTQGIDENVEISLSRDGGKTFEPIEESTENDGSYEWTVTGLASVNCMLKIEPIDDPSKGTTQGLFTITSGNNAPNTPSSPTPSNGALNALIDTSLSWTGGDPNPGDTVTYDVYFGTSDTPPLVAQDQSDTTYDLGTLNYNTPYYWKIVARDNHGPETEGPVWCFTTEIDPNDTDSDGMPDDWETAHFGDLSHDGTGDTDTDGLTDFQEYQNSTDPNDADTDNDGIIDGVEDANHNGLVDSDETDPCNSDTDGDAMPDGWEVSYGLNPMVDDASEDKDNDGYSNLQEYLSGTNPNDIDSKPAKKGDVNGDGTVDLTDAIIALQVLAGIEPTSTVHKEADVNGDGKIGIEELIYILQKVSGMR